MNPGARARRATVIYRWDEQTATPTAEARRAFSEALAALGIEDEALDDAQLALSELVANADQHACGPYEVRLRATAHMWVCEVADGDACVLPLPARLADVSFAAEETHRGVEAEAVVDLLAESGRGLRIVDCLTGGAWGVRTTETAKVVWFAIPGGRRRACCGAVSSPRDGTSCSTNYNE